MLAPRKCDIVGNSFGVAHDNQIMTEFADDEYDQTIMIKNDDAPGTFKFVETPFSMAHILSLKKQAPVIVDKNSDRNLIYSDEFLVVTSRARFVSCTRCYVVILSSSIHASFTDDAKSILDTPVVCARKCLLEGVDVRLTMIGSGRNIYLFEGAQLAYKAGCSDDTNKGSLGTSPTNRPNIVRTTRSPVYKIKETRRVGSLSPTRVVKLCW